MENFTTKKFQLEQDAVSCRPIMSFLPLLAWTLSFVFVYGSEALGHPEIFNKQLNEVVAMPLLFISVVSYALLAWKKRNEFAMAMTVLSVDFFCREWHFAGTSTGVYIVAAFVAVWFLYRHIQMKALIQKTPVEIWLWATGICYLLSQLIARRLFAHNHLGLIPMEAMHHIPLEETMETIAHCMLTITSFIAWRQFGTVDIKKEKQ